MVYKIMYPPIPNMGDLLNKDMLEESLQEKDTVKNATKKVNIITEEIEKNIEDVEKLKMFKLVIAPENMHLYKEIKSNKTILKNVVCE